MRRLRRWWHRIRGSVAGRRRDDEFAAELEAHLELLTSDNLRLGMSPDEARRAAALRLGNMESLKDHRRDQRGLVSLDGISRDVRVSWRGLIRAPAFTVTCVVTLALAIGANIAIFRLIDRVVLHPLDVPEASHLMAVQRTFESRGRQNRSVSMTWEEASRLRGLSSLQGAALSSASGDRAARPLAVSLDGGASTVAVEGRFVTANYFRVLGVMPAAGRDFGLADDTASAPLVAMLGYNFWRTRLGGDTGVIGRTIRINATRVVVVGVAPGGFTGTELGGIRPDLFLPLMSAPRVSAEGTQTDGRGGFFTGGFRGGVRSPVSPVSQLTIVARLTPERVEHARAELATRAASYQRASPALVPLVETMLPFDSRADLGQFLGLLAGAVGLTLLIGCANLAGLLLARTEERRSELAIRAALGAGRVRLVRQLAVEAGLLAATGGFAAFAVARWMEQGLSAFVLPGGIAVSSLRTGIDVRTVLFAMAATAAAAIVIGLTPAARTASRHLALDIKGKGGGSPRLGVTRLLVGVQVAVCVVLVFSGVLFVRTLSHALSTDLGFDRRGLLSAAVSTSESKLLGDPDPLAPVDALVERVRGIPGVSAVTAGPLPLVGAAHGSTSALRVDGVPVELRAPADIVFVAADYFTTLGQPMRRGRDFDAGDRTGARPVAIVNETAARQLWPEADPLEHHLGLQNGGPDQNLAVVGIVGDVKLKTLRETERAIIYLPRRQHPYYLAGYMAGAGRTFLMARTAGHAGGVAEAIRRAAADAGLPTQSVTTLSQGIDEILMPQRLGRTLLVLLAAIGLTLTLVGIYGLVSCFVARNTKEIGVRLSLGAGTGEIVRALLERTFLPIAAGVVTGSAVAWYGGRYADRFMYGMPGSDPATIALAVVTIVVSGLAAALLPTRRALRINPIETLRAE